MFSRFFYDHFPVGLPKSRLEYVFWETNHNAFIYAEYCSSFIYLLIFLPLYFLQSSPSDSVSMDKERWLIEDYRTISAFKSAYLFHFGLDWKCNHIVIPSSKQSLCDSTELELCLQGLDSINALLRTNWLQPTNLATTESLWKSDVLRNNTISGSHPTLQSLRSMFFLVYLDSAEP